ncbi:MAG: TetR/AcrR family transcriptional regulator C-terminal domain-containing protein [Gammaproteobacteria bacterium]|nr:TetR/AcrR family transcriptional regulator C-terminal domain-containing protein [Gammaproteobacteria bacterium]
MSPRRPSKKPKKPNKPAQARPQRTRRDLSRDKLIAVALDLLDRKGPAALTMRAVADAVEVTPMALYNHFSSKRDLLAAVADHVISAAEFDGGHADWREQLRHCFQTLRGLCLRHPGLPGLLEREGAAPVSVFAPMEVTLRALGDAGLDEIDSTRTYFLLISFTLGQAAYQARGAIEGLEPSKQIRAERIAGRGYRVTERLDLPARWDFDASFAFGLSLIVAGVEAMASKR